MLKHYIFRWVSMVIVCFFILLSVFHFNWGELKHLITQLWQMPLWLCAMFIIYGLAFVLRALAWKIYLGVKISFFTYLHALFYSLLVNHLLPIKAGDAVRVGIIAKQKEVKWDEALHSVVIMRVLDVLCLVILSGLGAFWLGIQISGFAFFSLLAFFIIGVVAVLYVLRRKWEHPLFQRHKQLMYSFICTSNSLFILSLILLSWVLEAVIIFGIAYTLFEPLSLMASVFVNSVTIAGQVFHWAPGGIGTYESVMSFSLLSTGWNMDNAYQAAVLSHGFKFVFSYLAGLYVLWVHPIRWRDIQVWRRKKREEPLK